MKFKKFISLLASLAMMVTAVTGAMTVSAETDSGDCGEVKWSFDSSTGKLTISGEGKMASPDIGVVPSGSIESYLVDYPEVYTYKKYKDNIKEVVIEEGVTSIGFCAFYKMPNLETVSLPSTINGFESCSIEASIFGSVCYSFAECPKLKNLTLSEGMTDLGGEAFYKCTALESVRIPSTLTAPKSVMGETGWGNYTFYCCSSLKYVTLPEGLTVIGGGAFAETAIESIVIPSTIQMWQFRGEPNNTACHNDAFYRCSKLSSVTFTNGIKSIVGTPFRQCPLLKKVTIPASVTMISGAFNESPNNEVNPSYNALEEVAFEEDSQITEIGSNAFRNCDNLKVIEIPENVTKFGSDAFGGCTSVEKIYVYSEKIDATSLAKSKNVYCNIYCYVGSVAWQSTTQNMVKRLDIEEEMSNTYDELSTAVEEANKYSEEKYTEESYGVLKALLEQASTKSKKSHILGMKYLTEDIYSAIDGLVDKSNEPSSDPSSSDPSDSSNPTDNSSDPSNSSDNNNQSQSPNTPATPSTSAPTTATPKPTTPPTVTTTVAKPAKVKAVKLKAKKKKLNVSWKKVSGATGYEVLSATNNKFTKNKKTVTVKKNKVTLKKLKPKKKYFVKVRAYKLANGNKYFGKWSKVVKKKVR